MEDQIKRPIVVWIAQLLLLGVVIFLILAPIKTAMDMWSTLAYYQIGSSSSFSAPALRYTVGPFLIRYFLIISPFIALNLAAVLGMAFRRAFGRWTGVGSLLLISLALVSHSLEGSPIFLGAQPILAINVEGPSQSLILITGALQIAFALITILVTTQLAFTATAKAFFRRRVGIASSEPPTPPSFDD